MSIIVVEMKISPEDSDLRDVNSNIWLHEVLQHEMALFEDTRGPSTNLFVVSEIHNMNLLSVFLFSFFKRKTQIPT